MTDQKPTPVPDALSEPFWKSLRDGVLSLQQCGACREFCYYPRPACPNCGSFEQTWRPVSGRGIIYSYTVIHRSTVPGFRGVAPYAVALVDLDEGPRMQTNIVGCPPEDVRTGMAVQLIPTPLTDEITLPMFEPVQNRTNRI